MTPALTGLIGYPVSHSLSPRIHAYWIEKYGVDAEYKLFTTAPPRLRQTMLHMRKKNVAGLNITVPHKQTVMEYLDAVDVLGTRIGAVNTVVNKNGVFTGTNTDAYGFITNLREGLGDLTPHLTHVLLLGAGGATRAAIVALQEAGAKKMTVTNRTADTAKNLAEEFGVSIAPWESRSEILSDVRLLVNTTSLGMEHQPELDINLAHLPESAAVHDIVYAPLETALIAAARARGHRVVDGLGMLLYQAQGAFHAWHGILPEVTADLRANVLEG